ncbi:MAG: UDP-N-acetylmuramate dehydrogenase [Bacteroidetes bacterium]|nr:UDP-N-acetylmuramate dehydrogenase [Bacteroidota bacterium]HET6243013.1 UDP-N-acetylmuramate dehydrogenase [Bacteroidia bacterium]
MQITENFPLKNYNSFGISAQAKYFVAIHTPEEIQELIHENTIIGLERLILGGGSNLLFTRNFDGIIIKNNIKGIELLKSDTDFYYLKAGAGEIWHEFVLHCIKNNYAGVENLSLIPGNVGASPMQNIGAYGVEIKDVFESLEAIEITTGEIHSFNNSDCNFGYRESVFKNICKDKYIITSVTYKLRKIPEFNTSYGAIDQELEAMGVKELSVSAISKAVCNIRSSKLPDPRLIGNAGSFFKNPVVGKSHYDYLKTVFPGIPAYAQQNETFKLAAGWLIEQCGWKGFRKNDAGVHAKQALVLVNYGNASGNEIYEISEEILKSVYLKFEVNLEREVNII